MGEDNGHAAGTFAAAAAKASPSGLANGRKGDALAAVVRCSCLKLGEGKAKPLLQSKHRQSKHKVRA